MTIRFFTPMVLIATILSGGEIFSAEISMQNYSIKDVIFYYKNEIEKKRTESTFQLLLFDELKSEDGQEGLCKKIKIVNTYLAQDSVHRENNRKVCLSTNETDYKILKEPEAMTEEDYFALQVCCAYFHTKYFLAIKEEGYESIADENTKEQIRFFVSFNLLGNAINYNSKTNIDKIDENLVHFQRSLDFLFSSDSLIKKYVKSYEKKMKELFSESVSEESDDDSESILVNPTSNPQSVVVSSIELTQETDISTEEDLAIKGKIDSIDTSVTVEPVNNPAEKTAPETITDNKQIESTASGVEKKPSKPIKNNPESALHSQNTFLGLFIVCLVAAGGGFYWFPEECSGFFKKSFRYIVQMGLE